MRVRAEKNASRATPDAMGRVCTVNPNCTGGFTVLVAPDSRTSTVDLVWTNNTNAASAVFTTPGFILTAIANRINPREAD